MTKIARTLTTAAVLSVFAIACSAAPKEEKASTTEALGEAACGTNALTTASAGTVISSPNFHCFWQNTATSPSSYGSPGCDNQYVVEIQKITPYITPARFTINAVNPIDQTTCAKIHETLGAYGHDASGWHVIGSYVGHGEWRAQDGIIAAHCEFVPEVNTIPSFFDPSKYDTVRAAASLWTVELFKNAPYNSYLPVTTGITGGNGC